MILLDDVNIFRRSYVTSTDWAPSIWGVSEFINIRLDVKIVALLQTTSPFIRAKDLYSAFQKLNYPEPFDCIFSVKR